MKMPLTFECQQWMIFDWFLTDCLTLSLSAVFFFFLSIFFEYLLTYRDIHRNEISEKMIVDYDNILLFPKIKATLLHLLKTFISYLTMFALMTYSLWVIMAVLLGHAIGYYIFGFMKGIHVRKVENFVCCSS